MTAPEDRAGILAKVSLSIGAVLLYVAGMQVVLWLGDDPADPTQPAGYDRTYEGIYRPSSDPLLPVELIPGANGVVNADGYVGTMYPRDKPAGVLRVLGLGDSITMYFSAERQNYLMIAERILNEHLDAPVQFLDFGVASYDTAAEVRQLETRGLAYRPDIVTVGYCLNDGIDFAFSVNETTGRFDVDPRSHSVDDVLATIQHAIASPQATLTPEAFFARVFESRQWTRSMGALDRLAVLSAEHGFDVVLVVFPVLLDYEPYAFAPAHAALRARARELGFGYLDLLPAYRRHGDPLVIGSAGGDVIHPNAIGHRIAGEELASHLRRHGHLERRGQAP